jgi:hypothetical protein
MEWDFKLILNDIGIDYTSVDNNVKEEYRQSLLMPLKITLLSVSIMERREFSCQKNSGCKLITA